ncbi:hypothetical protein NM688_g4677 [Phlebia brevispora]|uniref:Uncharacterized protein n=1 Tax=Phlebia brevispora TaxID=194682 RepID=A0ACC1T2C7_9APHY|nr:hypothetical protein NM688_g4677 [Phlebia brevispora]
MPPVFPGFHAPSASSLKPAYLTTSPRLSASLLPADRLNRASVVPPSLATHPRLDVVRVQYSHSSARWLRECLRHESLKDSIACEGSAHGAYLSCISQLLVSDFHAARYPATRISARWHPLSNVSALTTGSGRPASSLRALFSQARSADDETCSSPEGVAIHCKWFRHAKRWAWADAGMDPLAGTSIEAEAVSSGDSNSDDEADLAIHEFGLYADVVSMDSSTSARSNSQE